MQLELISKTTSIFWTSVGKSAALADAEKFAKRVARQLSASKSPSERQGEFIVVFDEGGTEVFRTPLLGD
jgi:hypothetical protein